MKVVTLKNVANVPVEGAERIRRVGPAGFPSAPAIMRARCSGNYNCSVVNFSQGCTTGWHTHTCDQILVVTRAPAWWPTSTNSKRSMSAIVVHIKAGERHWHGARPIPMGTHHQGGGRSGHQGIRPQPPELASPNVTSQRPLGLRRSLANAAGRRYVLTTATARSRP